ncbi:MAG: hypothetical protein HYX74_01570 [Acidobacteria bacterium]|nr:hypothetical protein [Acidobacteriota bacterium]
MVSTDFRASGGHIGASCRRIPAWKNRVLWKASPGVSMLEIMVALLISLTALAAAAPGLWLSLVVLQQDRKTLDREIAFETAWNEICSSTAEWPETRRYDAAVGAGRNIAVTAEALEQRYGLRRWRLSVSDPPYSEERWLSK